MHIFCQGLAQFSPSNTGANRLLSHVLRDGEKKNVSEVDVLVRDVMPLRVPKADDLTVHKPPVEQRVVDEGLQHGHDAVAMLTQHLHHRVAGDAVVAVQARHLATNQRQAGDGAGGDEMRTSTVRLWEKLSDALVDLKHKCPKTFFFSSTLHFLLLSQLAGFVSCLDTEDMMLKELKKTP